MPFLSPATSRLGATPEAGSVISIPSMPPVSMVVIVQVGLVIGREVLVHAHGGRG